MATKFRRLHPHFPGSVTRQNHAVWKLSEVENKRWPPLGGSTCVSYIHIIHTSTVQFVDIDNNGRAVTTLLQSCLEAEYCVFFICTSGKGGHLWFTAHPDVR